MALARRFNPPPNWPPAPPNWIPPATWQPDPAWGPPPPGWQLWMPYRANPAAFGWSFGFAGGFYLAILIVALIATGGRINPETAGSVMFPFAMGGLITGWIAWSRPTRWAVGLYPAIVFATSFGVSVLSTAGRMS